MTDLKVIGEGTEKEKEIINKSKEKIKLEQNCKKQEKE